MPGCDGSSTTKTCTICRGSGFKLATIKDTVSGRLKPVAIVCLGKKNEKAETLYPRFTCYRSVTEKDIEMFSDFIPYGNKVFKGNVDTFYFLFKVFLVHRFDLDNLSSSIITTSDMMGSYTSTKEEINKVSAEYVIPELLLVETGFGDGRPSFKRALVELLTLRYRENKKTWLFLKDTDKLTTETSPELDELLKEQKFEVLKKPLPAISARKAGF